jgi:hypothetical protein
MPRKPLELPPEIAKAFRADMRAYMAEPNQIKRDEIAIRQLYALSPYCRSKKLRLFEVKEMFMQMRDYA